MIRQHGTAVRVTVRVQPRASRTEVAGEHGNAIRIRVAAPPVDGAANETLCRFIAKLVGVAVSAVRIVGGTAGREKVVEIDDVEADDVRRVLLG